MIGAILAGIGALAAGGASAVLGLGSSVLGGLGGLAASGAGIATGAVAGIGSALSGGGTTTAQQMAAIAQPDYYETAAGGGILEGVSGISGMLADILPTVGGVMQIFNKPDETTAATTPAGTLPATPRVTVPTLPLVMPAAAQQPQAKVFTTTAPAAAKPDYLPFIVIGALILLMFMRKK